MSYSEQQNFQEKDLVEIYQVLGAPETSSW